jgi:hypothetical protein
MRQEGVVVELAFVGDDVRVRPRRHNEVVVADKFADPCPRHPAQVQQRDAAVPEVVRRTRLSVTPETLLRSATSVLGSAFPLHDVRNVEALCERVIQRSRLNLSYHDHEDLLAYLVEVCWRLSTKYEHGRGSTNSFAGWATYILRLRLIEWQREKYRRGGADVLGLDAPDDDPLGSSVAGSGLADDSSGFSADMRTLAQRARRPGRANDWLDQDADR